MSGYFSPEGKTVTWRGQTAVYAPAERDIMRALPVPEQAVIHLLKAFTDGDIRDSEQVRVAAIGGSPTEGNQSPLLRRTQSGDAGPEKVPVYIDADEIVFGEGLPKPRKRPIYALVWTWKQHRIHKTKKKCEQKMRAWKRWKERQGWTVTRHGTGYWANSPQGERHAIGIHEYDPESKERLK